jgi:hypothetical protein
VKRFARETAEHQMTVLHNDGLYRHLKFRNPKNSMYWFDLITVPGALIFQGDGDSFVFRRLTDMFEFFRGPVGEINPHYWSEKLTSSDRGQVMKYDQELLRKLVEDQVTEAIDDEAKEIAEEAEYLEEDEEAREPLLTGLSQAIRDRIIDELFGDESFDRNLVEQFAYYAVEADEFAYPRKDPDFQFHDFWEQSCRDYDWWFLWACQAIVWGIAYHDSGTRPSLPEPKASKPAAPHTNEPKRRAVVDVQLPADVTA